MFAEQKLLPANLHERLIAIVPMVGSGTLNDPKRPLFAPLTPDPKGILSYSYELTDDKKFAIVEFVALNSKAFAPILADKRVQKTFQKDKDKRDDMEKELKKQKADFDLDKKGGGR